MFFNRLAKSHIHATLLGDSIFDNRPYVSTGHEVIALLRNKIQSENNWKATLCAVDGNVIGDVTRRQLTRVPYDTTHLFISVGGNNALGSKHILTKSASTLGEALYTLNTVRERFYQEYHQMLNTVQSQFPEKNVILCTIYNPRYSGAEQIVSSVGLTALNDVIIQEAVKRGLPVIDLKSMFNDYNDYANPIEPSHQGGDKITNAMVRILKEHDFSKKLCTIYNS